MATIINHETQMQTAVIMCALCISISHTTLMSHSVTGYWMLVSEHVFRVCVHKQGINTNTTIWTDASLLATISVRNENGFQHGKIFTFSILCCSEGGEGLMGSLSVIGRGLLQFGRTAVAPLN